MATALSNLLALLALDNSAYLEGLAGSQAAADDFGTKLSNVGGAVVLGGLTAAATAVVAVGGAAFDAAEQVDEAFDKIAVGTGATGDQLAILQDDFKAVFASVPTDANTAAEAITILASRLDVSGEALQGIATPMLEVTRILGGDLTANAENFTRVIGDWSIPVGEASGSLDQLFVAAQNTGVPLDQLMERVVQYGAPMRNFNFSFEESAALLAAWEAQGVNVEIVMSGMRIAQGKFISQGVDMRAGLEDTIEAILGAANATEGLAIATEVFGAKAAGDMFDTISAGKFDIDAMVESMQNAEGAILETAAATADWPELWDKFKNSMTLALAPMGDTIRAAFGDALNSIVEVFGRPDVQASITQFANAAATAIGWIADKIPAVIDGIFSFITFLQNNQGLVIGIFAALGVAAVAWGVTTAAAAWSAIVPMLPVIAVLALVAGAVWLLYEAWTNNWGGIRDSVTAIWAEIQPTLQMVWDWLSENLPVAFETMKEIWQAVWAEVGPVLAAVWGFVEPILKWIIGFLGDNIPAGLRAMGDIWSGTWQFIEDFTSGKLGTLSELFKNTWDFINTTIMLAVENIKLVYAAFMAAMEGDWYTFGASLRGIVDNVFAALANTVVTAFENIYIVLEGLIGFDWDSLVGLVLDTLEQIPDVIGSINWFDVGANIMLGIQDGILGMIDTVISTAMYAGEAILAALQGFFGINSPSEVMKSLIGENLGLGVIEGWEAVIQPTVLQPALAGAATGIPARAMGGSVSTETGAGAGANSDAMLLEQINMTLRNLPNDIARAVKTAIAKGNA